MDAFTQAYIVAALWSSTDNSTPQGGEPLDANYSAADIAPQSIRKMEEDCRLFQSQNAELLEKFYDAGLDAERAGHDFWLTRNGHGSGFWDEPRQSQGNSEVESLEPVTKALTDASHAFGEQDIYVGDDNKLYVMGGESDQHDLPLKASLLKKADPNEDKILEALRVRPMTTGEIEKGLFAGGKYSNNSWPAITALKQKGLITQKQMRWHLVASIVRGYAITGTRNPRWLQSMDWHALNIALKTMNMPPEMAGVMGGPNEAEARKTIKRLTGKEYEELPDSMKRGRAPKSIPAALRGKKAFFSPEDAKKFRDENQGSNVALEQDKPGAEKWEPVDPKKRGSMATKTAMSRKDYILIANVLIASREAGEHADIADLFAEALKADNAQFNEEHFLAVVRGEKGLTSRPPRQAAKKADWRDEPYFEDWQHEVANGDTRLGYEEWMQHMVEAGNIEIPELAIKPPQRSLPSFKDIKLPHESSKKPRLAGAKLGGQITQELIAQAKELIDLNDDIIYDVAANSGQIADNVKHMSWFQREVAEWLADDPTYYAEAMQKHQGGVDQSGWYDGTEDLNDRRAVEPQEFQS